jgi:hypothetical protein
MKKSRYPHKTLKKFVRNDFTQVQIFLREVQTIENYTVNLLFVQLCSFKDWYLRGIKMRDRHLNSWDRRVLIL